MCNLYCITKGPQAIRDLAKAMRDTTGNLPPLPGVFPDYAAPIVRNAPDGVRELTAARWGMPTPAFAPQGLQIRSGRHERPQRRLAALATLAGVANRCVAPFPRFSEIETLRDAPDVVFLSLRDRFFR